MSRPRDSQALAVESAEIGTDKTPRFHSLRQIQAFLDKVMTTTPWTKAELEHLKGYRDGPVGIQVARGRKLPKGQKRRTAARCVYLGEGEYLLTFFHWPVSRSTVLHEIAHCASNPLEPAHGPAFCRMMLKLYRAHMGQAATDQLAAHYQDNGIQPHGPDEAPQRTEDA